MYKDHSQLRIEDFVFLYGKRLGETGHIGSLGRGGGAVRGPVCEQRPPGPSGAYGAGSAADPAAAEVQRHMAGETYRQESVSAIFHWDEKYGPCPFGASTPVAFRKRFSEKDMAALLETSVPKEEKKDDSDDGNDPPNSGTLILDATCCPADIAYSQDVDLLNQARETVEKTADELCEQTARKKPRMYRRCARRDYLRLSKSRKRSAKAVRTAVRKQLQYICRDVSYVVELVQNGAELSQMQADRLNVVTTVYEQQRILFETGTHSIPRMGRSQGRTADCKSSPP